MKDNNGIVNNGNSGTVGVEEGEVVLDTVKSIV